MVRLPQLAVQRFTSKLANHRLAGGILDWPLQIAHCIEMQGDFVRKNCGTTKARPSRQAGLMLEMMPMERDERIRQMVLCEISDDYENVDQIILPHVAKQCAKLGLALGAGRTDRGWAG
jgi:hypothetical protein